MKNIIYQELRKVFVSPVIASLLIIFTVYNIFLIYDHSFFRDEIAVVNEVIGIYGTDITPDSIAAFENEYDSALENLNVLAQKKLSKTYQDASSFFTDISTDSNQTFTEAELTVASKAIVFEMYLDEMNGIGDTYEKLDLKRTAESEIANYNLSGEAAESVRKTFSQLETRKAEMIENGEHQTLFFHGKTYMLHTFLFRNLLKAILIEALILSVLAAAYINTYEFENKTHFITYSTKRGRKLAVDKLIASFTTSMSMTTFLIAFAMVCYFSVFNYSNVWNVPISSYFNAEFKFPYISWFELNFAEYFGLCILLLYICQLFFAAIAFVLSIFIKNSYLVFVVFLLVWGMAVMIPGLVPLDSNLLFTTRLNPFTLVNNPHLWFMAWGAFRVKFQEITTVGIWSFILLAGLFISLARFKKQNIY
ncbi:hypothetical protein AM500_17230 [Bacillus sp. FJAT-18017]|uniref:hypothetical protein n=1 Tax=Bacillus sp. FJAT-18017 TaxID=1705566 RepID=UPI0006B0682E|nr:hypothetical protein [Bacillus sp. FJAT-18017]ALC91346.1 hypothetical protein AM500_17230 [Bacillus sp. FJAT-18017]